MNNCVFLDRDGTLIKLVHYLSDPRKVQMESGVVEGLRMLKSRGYIFGVITNQSIIGRGLATSREVELVNEKLIQLLLASGIELDFFLVCPHTPVDSCNCRKPNTMLGLQAIDTFSINVDHSYMIGDQESDVEFGINLGVKTIQIGGSKEQLVIPDKYSNDMIEAATWILESGK